jgi:aryl-alcohol dehydrogenase-like predicted oxidoreductase
VADWKIQLPDGKPHEVKDHSLQVCDLFKRNAIANVATFKNRKLICIHCIITIQNFWKQVEETEKNLGDYVNLYQVHSATFESGILTNHEVHSAMAKCRRERGWKLGLSVSGPMQDKILLEETIPLFDSVQCTYNLLEQRASEALCVAHHAGMDVIVKEGLGNGRVLRHPVVLEYSQQLKCEPDQLALGCILAQPFQPKALSGAITPDQLVSNMKASEIADRLLTDNELLEDIMSRCVTSSEQYWEERASLQWN